MDLKAGLMILIIFFLKHAVLNSGITADPASQQLPNWAKHNDQRKTMITNFLGTPMKSNTASLTTDQINGPILLQDTNFLEQTASFDRERIPERVVHSVGAGAHGVFKVTHSITKYTKADVFSKIGQETPVFVRFSTTVGELGSSDIVQDARGFAIRFYTAQGNWDLTAISAPVFFFRDPILFSSFIHSQKRNPVTHLPDMNARWDFASLRPETTHRTLHHFSDSGLPDGFRHMNGFGINAFKFVNSVGKIHFVKFHLHTAQGLRSLTYDESVRLSGVDPNYSTRDLYNAIEEKNYPTWLMYVQIMKLAQALKYNWTFDPVQIWPEDQFPLIPVGELTLNKNPKNYFAEVEQIGFNPGNLVPGIELSPDRLLLGRTFSYSDTQRHRLGPNFLQIPINRPLTQVHNYMRDGPSCLYQGSEPNYYPNSFNGPSITQQDVPEYVCGLADRYDSGPVVDNFSQASIFYNSLSLAEKTRLVENIVRSLREADISIQKRALANMFAKVDSHLMSKIQIGLATDVKAKLNKC